MPSSEDVQRIVFNLTSDKRKRKRNASEGRIPSGRIPKKIHNVGTTTSQLLTGAENSKARSSAIALAPIPWLSGFPIEKKFGQELLQAEGEIDTQSDIPCSIMNNEHEILPKSYDAQADEEDQQSDLPRLDPTELNKLKVLVKSNIKWLYSALEHSLHRLESDRLPVQYLAFSLIEYLCERSVKGRHWILPHFRKLIDNTVLRSHSSKSSKPSTWSAVKQCLILRTALDNQVLNLVERWKDVYRYQEVLVAYSYLKIKHKFEFHNTDKQRQRTPDEGTRERAALQNVALTRYEKSCREFAAVGEDVLCCLREAEECLNLLIPRVDADTFGQHIMASIEHEIASGQVHGVNDEPDNELADKNGSSVNDRQPGVRAFKTNFQQLSCRKTSDPSTQQRFDEESDVEQEIEWEEVKNQEENTTHEDNEDFTPAKVSLLNNSTDFDTFWSDSEESEGSKVDSSREWSRVSASGRLSKEDFGSGYLMARGGSTAGHSTAGTAEWSQSFEHHITSTPARTSTQELGIPLDYKLELDVSLEGKFSTQTTFPLSASATADPFALKESPAVLDTLTEHMKMIVNTYLPTLSEWKTAIAGYLPTQRDQEQSSEKVSTKFSKGQEEGELAGNKYGTCDLTIVTQAIETARYLLSRYRLLFGPEKADEMIASRRKRIVGSQKKEEDIKYTEV